MKKVHQVGFFSMNFSGKHLSANRIHIGKLPDWYSVQSKFRSHYGCSASNGRTTYAEGSWVLHWITLSEILKYGEDEFSIVCPCIITDSLWIKPTDALNSNFIVITTLHVSGSLSAHHQEFLAVHRLWYILCSCDDRLLPGVGWNAVPSSSW